MHLQLQNALLFMISTALLSVDHVPAGAAGPPGGSGADAAAAAHCERPFHRPCVLLLCAAARYSLPRCLQQVSLQPLMQELRSSSSVCSPNYPSLEMLTAFAALTFLAMLLGAASVHSVTCMGPISVFHVPSSGRQNSRERCQSRK